MTHALRRAARGLAACLALAALGACALPRDTALAEWARSASVSVDQPALAMPPGDAARAQQEALAVYLYALGLLAEGAPLTFREAAYAPLARRAAAGDPAAAQAVEQLGALLRRASRANPAPSEAPDGARGVVDETYPEDTRLLDTVRDADAPLQALVAALGAAPLGRNRASGPPRPEEARPASARAAAEARYAIVLAEIGTAHALLRARGIRMTQRDTTRLVRDAEERLLRAAMGLPTDGARGSGTPALLATVLGP